MSTEIGNPHATVCRCKRPRIRLARTINRMPIELLLCTDCDAGARENSGPPILLEYLRKGHQ